MKNVISGIALLLLSTTALAQGYIQSDTTINKTIKLKESFELQFVHCPGCGYSWGLMKKCDSTVISIQLVSDEVMAGNGPVGGHYISTYKYTGLATGSYLLEYFYRRPWLKEYLFKCSLTIIVE
ncbi:MAG: protease inhibitor I42 family protein [Bacteroidetes bacterium]|nr:protease inhibitor I42 family protein [Bacteroidota bacterium]